MRLTRSACRPFAVALLLLTGCSSSSPPSADKPAAAGGRIAVVVSTLNNPWFVVLANTAQARAEELGYAATIFDSQNDTSKEAAHFENILAGGFQAILFNATDSDGSIANVRRAKDADVPVFCMDREVNDAGVATSQILSDNYGGCVTLGEYFIESLGEKGNYVEIMGYPGDNNTRNRSEGFHSVVDRFPGWKLVAQQNADFDRAKALEVMETILQANPDVDAVFCANDAMAMGAYQALVAADRADEVKLFGFDGADEVVKLIREGKIVATGMQFPKTMARQAAENADAWIKGQCDFPQKVPVAVELVNADTVDQYDDFGAKEEK